MPKTNRHFQLDCKMAKTGGNKAEIMVYSRISSHRGWDDEPNATSRDFDKELRALGDVDEITVRINSPGGAVSEAVAIRTALMKHRAKKTVDIEGMCASAATLIACLPGAHVRMARGSDYMIHRCSYIAMGTADDMLSAYNSMVNTDNSMAEIYAERTGKTQEECLNLMKATTWYTVDKAIAAGFVDEEITAADACGEEPIVACAMDAEIAGLMKECYANVPGHIVAKAWQPESPAEEPVSNERTAVAAENSSENTANSQEETEEKTMEIKDATAEVIQQQNPEAAEQIAKAAVEAERNRRTAILSLKPKGAKWDKMAEDAIANGDSEADFLRAVIAEQAKTGEEYLDSRRAETKAAEKIGAGDAHDNDDNSKEAEDKVAKEIAELAATMGGRTAEMA